MTKTDWHRVDALADKQIDFSDVPELSDEFFAKATLRQPRQLKEVTVQLDSEIVTWFKAQGATWEQRLNAALRVYMEAHRAYQTPPQSTK